MFLRITNPYIQLQRIKIRCNGVFANVFYLFLNHFYNGDCILLFLVNYYYHACALAFFYPTEQSHCRCLEDCIYGFHNTFLLLNQHLLLSYFYHILQTTFSNTEYPVVQQIHFHIQVRQHILHGILYPSTHLSNHLHRNITTWRYRNQYQNSHYSNHIHISQ